MNFGITENGDLFLDNNNSNFTNIIYGDEEETAFKKSKSIIIDYFILRRNFKDNFIKNQRNNFTDSQISLKLDEHLSTAFWRNLEFLEKINYDFINKGREFEILFTFKFESGEIRTLLLHEVKL